MRSVFVGYFRPKDDELSQMWSEGIFVVDANVLLNLYRYSSGTRKELEKALEVVKDRIFIPHQAAKEFLGKRLDVTAGQANEYAKAIKSIN
ncbi:MAG: PIN-like domain-containing protein, partial [Aphanizomenon sp.]